MQTRRQFIATGAALTAWTGTLFAEEASEPEGFLLRDFYTEDGSFSELARSLEGQRFEVAGYMAPPLRAQSNFFVLTMLPMALCPFCEDEADWPEDILAVYAKREIEVVPFNVPIKVRGRLELGTIRDEETGFVSRVRLADATFETA